MARQPKLLLIGADGQLGWELARRLQTLGDVVCTTRGDAGPQRRLDLEDGEAIAGCVRSVKPDIVLNAAAYTAVDGAEEAPDTAHAVNAGAPSRLAAEVKRVEALLIHYSTDYVFNGDSKRAYRETDRPDPINVYGRTKLAGEEAIRQSGAAHLILRSSWIYGARGKNFLLTILDRAASGAPLRVVDDQLGSPTSAYSLAAATAELVALCQANGRDWLSAHAGTYHLAAGGSCSWYEFAREILRASEIPNPHLEPVSTSEYRTAAKRPCSSVLDCSLALSTFGVALDAWEHQLAAVMETLTRRLGAAQLE